MKKLLSFLILLFIPFMVKAADLEIKSIELVEKQGEVEINSEPTTEGLKINFDLSFNNVNDYVKYKTVVKNNLNEELEIDDEPQYGQNEYIKYSISFPDDSKIVKAKGEKEIIITVSYDKEVPTEEFDNGEYNEQGSVEIALNEAKPNPNTAAFISVSIITLLIVSIISFTLAKSGMKKTAFSLFLIALIAIPVITLAVKKVSFHIDSKIHITDRCYVLDTTYGSFEQGKETKAICVPFAENKYYVEEFYSVLWGQKQLDTDNLVLTAMRNYMTKDSYIKVYDSEDKLLLTVTLDDFPKPLLNVNTIINYAYYRINKTVGLYDREDVRIEVSPDLEEYNSYDVAYLMYSGKPGNIVIKGPWISNQDAINKIEYLSSQSTEENTLKGFERDKFDSHVYHAIWGPAEHIK